MSYKVSILAAVLIFAAIALAIFGSPMSKEPQGLRKVILNGHEKIESEVLQWNYKLEE